jgi:hypothetical protein
MKRTLATLAAAAALLAPAGAAFAWAETGHRMIGRLAMQALPAELPVFLHEPAAVAEVEELAREPDRWRGAGRTHDADRDAAHFIDLDDQGQTLAGVALDKLPARRADFEAALTAAHVETGKSGYLPYAIVDGWQQLVKDFAYWRVETAALARDADPAHKAWYARDLKLREALIVRDLGVWAHYVGDGSMPMHLSIHYNGWGPYPNPEGFTREPIHSLFEGTYVKSFVSLDEVRARMKPYQACTAGIEGCTAAYLHATWTQLVPTYRLEKAVGFRAASPEGRAFVAERIAAAASELRDLVVDAWTASATASAGYAGPGKPAVTLQAVQSGAVDPWDAIYGTE